MSKKKQITIYLNEDLYEAVKQKCHDQLNVCMGTFIKIFLKAFVTQEGVGFFVGNEDLRKKFKSWLIQKHHEKEGPRDTWGSRPSFRDIFNI